MIQQIMESESCSSSEFDEEQLNAIRGKVTADDPLQLKNLPKQRISRKRIAQVQRGHGRGSVDYSVTNQHST